MTAVLFGAPAGQAEAQSMPKPASCSGGAASDCVAQCESAMTGFNDLLEAQRPDLTAIRARALTVKACDDMASDDDNDLSAATRDEIAASIATLQSDYTTATACAYAIIETEAKNLKPGDEYDQSFDLFGCPQYAVAARAGVDDERNCAREKAEFDLVITTDDLERLKEFEVRSQCSVYKSQAYTRILGLENGTASTGGVAGLDIKGPTGLYSNIPLPPKRDPAPPTIEVRN